MKIFRFDGCKENPELLLPQLRAFLLHKKDCQSFSLTVKVITYSTATPTDLANYFFNNLSTLCFEKPPFLIHIQYTFQIFLVTLPRLFGTDDFHPVTVTGYGCSVFSWKFPLFQSQCGCVAMNGLVIILRNSC